MKKFVILIAAIVLERAVAYNIVKKTLDELNTIHKKELDRVHYKSFSDGWDSGLDQGRTEGRRQIIEQRDPYLKES